MWGGAGEGPRPPRPRSAHAETSVLAAVGTSWAASQASWNLAKMQTSVWSIWGGAPLPGGGPRPGARALTPLRWVCSASWCTGGGEAQALGCRQAGALRLPAPASQPQPGTPPAGRPEHQRHQPQPRSRHRGISQRFPAYPCRPNPVYVCFSPSGGSVSTGDRWLHVDGFFNLLTVKRLYFDWFDALLRSVQSWCDNY